MWAAEFDPLGGEKDREENWRIWKSPGWEAASLFGFCEVACHPGGVGVCLPVRGLLPGACSRRGKQTSLLFCFWLGGHVV